GNPVVANGSAEQFDRTLCAPLEVCVRNPNAAFSASHPPCHVSHEKSTVWSHGPPWPLVVHNAMRRFSRSVSWRAKKSRGGYPRLHVSLGWSAIHWRIWLTPAGFRRGR